MGCRTTRITPQSADILGVKNGDMIEFVPQVGAPLRSWVKISDEADSDQVKLGPLAQLALKFKDGDVIQWRKLKQAPEITHYNQQEEMPFTLKQVSQA